MKMDLLIRGATVYTQDAGRRVLPRADVAVKDGKIAEVGDTLHCEAERILDGTGKFLFPGMVNTHVHIFQSLLKGVGADHNLMEWIQLCTSRYGPKMTPRFQRAAARLAIMECLKSGVTTLTEFFYTQQDPDLVPVIIEEMEHLGIRGIVVDAAYDCGTEYGTPAGYLHPAMDNIKRTERLCKRYHTPEHPNIRIWAGASMPWTTTEENLRLIAEFSRETGVPYSMHTLETDDDNELNLKTRGQPLVPFLEKIGFLSERFLAVHCVKLTQDEAEVFRRYDVKINYNPMANAYLGSGIPPMALLKKRGLTLSMGTDGAASNNTSDMLETLKAGLLLQKAQAKRANVLSAQDMLDFATCSGAAAVHQQAFTGSIEAGKSADLFLFDPDFLRSTPVVDPVATLMYSSPQENIAATIVAGRVVYERGAFACGLTEQEVVAQAKAAAAELLSL